MTAPGPSSAELCTGTYLAVQVDEYVVVTTIGIHPTTGYMAFFEQNPIDVFPPEFTLWHIKPEYGADVVTEFSVGTMFLAAESVGQVIVHDANGESTVRVLQLPSGHDAH